MYTFLLFDNADSGMKVYRILLERGFDITISPTPREASSCCGISVMIRNPDQTQEIKRLADAEKLPVISWFTKTSGFDSGRDRFL